jgi:hypothetical protein
VKVVPDTSADPPESRKDSERPICPVCGQVFDNEAGRGGHLAVSKDADHEAYRTLGVIPSRKVAEGKPEGAPAKVPEGSVEGKVEGIEPNPAKVPKPISAGPSEPTFEFRSETLPQQEAQGQSDLTLVTFEPPKLIEPLRPEPSQPSQQGIGLDLGKPSPKVTVDLEPIIAGGLALGLNGLVLNKPGDGQLTQEAVLETHFPEATTACMKLYFPDLPIDHPIVALIASGVTLGYVVMSLKAKDGAAPEAPTTAPTSPPAPAAQAPPAPVVPAAPGPKGTTGDPYWDAILAKAGGVAL